MQNSDINATTRGPAVMDLFCQSQHDRDQVEACALLAFSPTRLVVTMQSPLCIPPCNRA